MPPDWFKHAFAIEPADRFVPSEAQRDLVDRLCRQIIARELSTPALLFLETVRPLNYVTAQTLQFFAPFIAAAGGAQVGAELAAFFEHRGSIDFLCQRIEQLERESRTGRPPGAAEGKIPLELPPPEGAREP